MYKNTDMTPNELPSRDPLRFRSCLRLLLCYGYSVAGIHVGGFESPHIRPHARRTPHLGRYRREARRIFKVTVGH